MYSTKKIVFVHFETKKRKQIIQIFQKILEKKDLFYNDSFDFFMKNYKILKIEFTCTKIFRVVLFESDFIRNTKKQIIARISKLNQKNQIICLYRLLCLNTIERQIIDSQNRKLKFQNMIFNFSANKS